MKYILLIIMLGTSGAESVTKTPVADEAECQRVKAEITQKVQDRIAHIVGDTGNDGIVAMMAANQTPIMSCVKQ